MSESLTVLISSAGRRNALINCFRESAKLLGVDLRIVATDMNPNMSSACHIADASYQVPRCTDAGFLPAIIHVCEKESVAVLIPTIDTELTIFA